MKTITQTSEKCDRCSARAQHKAVKPGFFDSVKELYFCGHHNRTHNEQLIAYGWIIENLET